MCLLTPGCRFGGRMQKIDPFTRKGSVRMIDLLYFCYSGITHSTITWMHFVIFRCHVLTFDLGKMWEKRIKLTWRPTRVTESCKEINKKLWNDVCISSDGKVHPPVICPLYNSDTILKAIISGLILIPWMKNQRISYTVVNNPEFTTLSTPATYDWKKCIK